jgi:PurA ssDNA and RNA-binding protein
MFPASGLVEFGDALDEVIAQAPAETESADAAPSRGPPRAMHHRELVVEGKRVVVESGANKRGSYLRILDGGGTSSVMMPWGALSDLISALQQLKDEGEPVAPINPIASTASTADSGLVGRANVDGIRD